MQIKELERSSARSSPKDERHPMAIRVLPSAGSKASVAAPSRALRGELHRRVYGSLLVSILIFVMPPGSPLAGTARRTISC